jgi:TRAP transporter TAXI family solute receptor
MPPKIDGFLWVGGLPTAAVTDLGATPGLKIKMIDHGELVPKMLEKYPGLYAPAVIKAKSYPGQDTDNSIAVVWNIMVVNAKMSDKMAYDLTKTMFDKKADWVRVHREANELNYANQSVKNAAIPFHPGAVKYYAEHGVKLQ